MKPYQKWILGIVMVLVLALGFWAYLQPTFVFNYATTGMMC